MEDKEYSMKEDFDKVDEDFDKAAEDFDLAGDEAHDDFVNSEEYMYSHIERMQHIESILQNAVDTAKKRVKDAPEEQFAIIVDEIAQNVENESGGLVTSYEAKERILAALGM